MVCCAYYVGDASRSVYSGEYQLRHNDENAEGCVLCCDVVVTAVNSEKGSNDRR